MAAHKLTYIQLLQGVAGTTIKFETRRAASIAIWQFRETVSCQVIRFRAIATDGCRLGVCFVKAGFIPKSSYYLVYSRHFVMGFTITATRPRSVPMSHGSQVQNQSGHHDGSQDLGKAVHVCCFFTKPKQNQWSDEPSKRIGSLLTQHQLPSDLPSQPIIHDGVRDCSYFTG